MLQTIQIWWTNLSKKWRFEYEYCKYDIRKLISPYKILLNILIYITLMKKLHLILTFMSVAIFAFAAPTKKIIDQGGSGMFKAEAISEASLPGFVVYKPQDLQAAVKHQGPLPLLVFANGGCNDTSLPHEKMLNDLASYGYVVIALGQMQERIDDRQLNKSPNEDMIHAIDWAEEQQANPESAYYKSIDMEYVALGGQSCGGAQVLANCADPRVKSCIMLNSGMGNMEMSGASKETLKNLHCPILYIVGGEGDVAYQNAILDYDRINHVPVAFANSLRVGHGGTFHEPYGGSYSKMVRLWLSWQFKDQRNNLDVFLRNRLHDFADYTMKAKNFPETNEPFIVKEMHCKSRDGKDIFGLAYIPQNGEKKMATVIMAHGYNGTHREPQDYAATLAMRGIASYIFDFCGGGNHSQSEGITTEMTIFTEKENVEDITRTVKTWDFVDPERVALLGCSQGGLVASLTAAANPDMFKALVLVYPALMIPETAPRMLQQFDANKNEPVELMGMKLGRNYYEKINGLDVMGTISAFKGATYIVYGDKDMIAAGGTIDQAAKAYEKCEVKVIEGGNHGFSDYRHHVQASEGIANFIQQATAKPRGRFPRMDMDALNNDPNVHDPVMAYEDGTYYMFTTGMGVGVMSSKDLKSWKFEKAPLSPIPTWPKEYVPAYGGHTWAPDIIKKGKYWYLYYSCSTFGKNISAIGVARTRSLNPESPKHKWEDLGMVVKSEPGKEDWNAIDPNIIIDKKGRPWMTWGSFWDGIQLVQLKKDMKTPVGEPKTIARRRMPEVVAHFNPHANTNAIEAPFIAYHDGYYYLFASWDYCCKGLSSNYATVVGRSKTVDGPYLDKEGKDMAETGGTLIVGPNEKYSGVGHCSVYEFNGTWYFIAHGYDKAQNGASKLYLREIKWVDGWPTIVE